MNIMEREYIRTDKNGTKYFRDWKCPHCDGLGSRREWSHTMFTCWKCNGTGQLAEPRIVKEYTPEYLAVMAEKNRKKQEKKYADKIAAYAADMTKAYREGGFNNQGHIYVVTESDTFSIKEDLKADGARWRPTMQKWFFLERPSNWKTVEVDWADFCEINEYGVIVAKDGRWENNIIEEIIKSKES